MMIWYISKYFSRAYQVLDEDGERIGDLTRTDGQSCWTYTAQNGSKRILSRDLAKSLAMLNRNVKWMEQLTHFEEVK